MRPVASLVCVAGAAAAMSSTASRVANLKSALGRVSPEAIRDAAARIAPYAKTTPILRDDAIDAKAGCAVRRPSGIATRSAWLCYVLQDTSVPEKMIDDGLRLFESRPRRSTSSASTSRRRAARRNGSRRRQKGETADRAGRPDGVSSGGPGRTASRPGGTGPDGVSSGGTGPDGSRPESERRRRARSSSAARSTRC